tara:strand:+ start:375 stop:506 length:132 start_codon:yes stop_codon:yes gene_type:complete
LNKNYFITTTLLLNISADVFKTQVYIPVGKLLISILIELLEEL